MGSLKDPKTWIPNINPKDCSQKICTISCPQWCKYIILPSPPPALSKDDLGGTTLSPAVIVIITLICTFLLLIGYYFIISLLLKRRVDNLETSGPELGVDGHDLGEDHSNYVPWIVLGKGLDEAFIKSIRVCKYKKEDGFVTCADCLVCLGEFQEDESIKLLPKCSHAFHAYCIDTWLKTHLKCPLCRANVCCDVKSPPPMLPPPVMTTGLEERDATFEIRDEGRRKIKRSKSMDYLCPNWVSTTQVLFFSQRHEMTRQEVGTQGDVWSSENVLEGNLRV